MFASRRCIVAFAVCLGLLGASGCGADADKATVTGEVTLDSQPLKSGIIRFVPADGQSQTADTTITDGKFKAQVPLGEKRVEISAPKVIGKQKMYDTPDSPTVDQVAELIPARYNVQTELKMTVQGGIQEKRFDLTSK